MEYFQFLVYLSMDKQPSFESQRFKKLRESLNETQQSFAEKLGIKGSTADIERGKSKITGSIVAELLKQYKINPLWFVWSKFSEVLGHIPQCSTKGCYCRW